MQWLTDCYILLVCSDLEEYYLTPLKRLFVAKDLQFRYLIVVMLTSLLGNLACLEWPRLAQRKRKKAHLGQHDR